MRLIKELPNPFIMENEDYILSIIDWQQRKIEIKTMMMNIQYGTMPDPPESVSIKTKERKIGNDGEIYEKIEPNKYSWGSISVWAWGSMRLVDYALTLPEINHQQVMISGHSRNGKTALLASALDDRISLVNPAGSGYASAGSYLALGEKCGDLASLTNQNRWWVWTHPNFENWAMHEEKLPFDQHLLMGLVAPRALLRTEGNSDTWANPEGTCISFLATQPIFDFLNVPFQNGIYFHEGGHAHTEEDTEVLLEFSNTIFFNKPTKINFKNLLYGEREFPKAFRWKKPKNFT